MVITRQQCRLRALSILHDLFSPEDGSAHSYRRTTVDKYFPIAYNGEIWDWGDTPDGLQEIEYIIYRISGGKFESEPD